MKKLEGIWIEIIKGQIKENRGISISSFTFSNGKFRYNGVNFNTKTLKEVYTWRSKYIIHSRSEEKIYYIYEVKESEKNHKSSYGFGTLSINKYGINKYAFSNGFFIDAEKISEGTEFVQNLDMLSLDDVSKKISIKLDGYNDLDIENKHSSRRENLIIKISDSHWYKKIEEKYK